MNAFIKNFLTVEAYLQPHGHFLVIWQVDNFTTRLSQQC